MDLKNKKGFITIYVMLAMMFFIVFVVTASVTASRKIKLQTDANAALYDIYNEDIDHIIQDVDTIPIYTQSQFLQIAAWVADTTKETEYMYINDVVYTLNKERYEDTNDSNNDDYEFQLKTDLWFKEDTTTTRTDTDDKANYPYIMDNWIHELLRRTDINQDDTETLNIGLYDDIDYAIYISTTNGPQKYGIKTIEIREAYQFLQIGTEKEVDGIYYGVGNKYELQNNIEITTADYEEAGIDDFANRPEFTGILDGQGKIVEGLKITVNNACTSAGFFKSNSGTIKDLTLTKVSTDIKANITDFGIIAGINDTNGKIDNCNIMLSDERTEAEKNISGNGKTIANFGILVGTNKGEISKDNGEETNIQGFKIQNVVSTNLGVVAGNNTGTIANTNLLKCEIIGTNITGTNIGLISGQNTNLIENIELDNCILTGMKGTNIGGVAGYNTNSIQNISVVNDFELNLTGAVTSVGGIVGKNDEIVTKVTIDCNFKINSTTGTQTNIGGIVGLNNGATISNIKVNSAENVNAYIEIIPNGGNVEFIGGVTGSNENASSIRYCYITGTIDDRNNSKTTDWHAVGGITGRSIGKNTTRTIEYCYSNVKIMYLNKTCTLGTGGIVGVTGWSGSEGKNEIKNSTYVNEIIVQNKNTNGNWVNASITERTDGNKNNACAVGGIVGTYWLGNTNITDNTLTMENCYMNGKIPTEDSRAGALIGIIAAQSINSTVNLNARYNKAYRWLGYVSTITANVTLNYNCTADETNELNVFAICNTENNSGIDKENCYCLHHAILAGSGYDNEISTAKYAKMVIYKNRGNSNVIQLSELNFWNGNTEATYKNNIKGNYQGNTNELVGNLIDNNTNTKYCVSNWNGVIKPLVIVIEFTNEITLSEFNKYSYHTANDASERDPITWNLYFKEDDDSNYVLYDSKVNATIPASGQYKTETTKWEYSAN